ncbi:transcriptional regulator, ArsR family [Ignisphaera aggregans DSM 17230]|uniref:Transcriptional regulator, ArsR family n=1 Tax=Ignisphaera aggregans (strain DSM 17230 / JCM 13409 / AQ1.S1) TaxID=583356 RepID=E0SSR2_IGNAA|nr:transcriptional regulator, ArsR family [Ignisphaera aggregans DSM 17230]
MAQSSESERLDIIINSIKNKINIQILLLLSIKPSYTREIANVLNLDESSISRRLKFLEQLGVVRGFWKRVGDKNVKVYELNIKEFSIRFDRGALEVSLSEGEKYREIIRLRKTVIPECKELVGREEELYAIHSSNVPIIHLWGLPGIGKSSLVAWYIKRYRERDPVYWYVPIASDTAETLKLKLALLISTITDLDARTIMNSDIHTLANLLNEHSMVLVFDDFHDVNKQVKEYVLSLVEKIEYPARVFIISRFKEKELPYWKGKVLDIEVKPLPLNEAMELTRKLSKDLSINLSQHDILRITELSGGIPLLIHGIINLYKSTGLSLTECINRVVASYYESEIGGIIDENSKLILELLIAGGGVLPIEILCNILSLRQTACLKRLNLLERLGLIEILDEDVKVREMIGGLPKVANTSRLRHLVKLIASALNQHPDIKQRMHGLLLMADNCLIKDAIPIIEKRLLHGSSWMTCCFDLYHSILEKLQRCEGLTAQQESLLAVEKALVEITTNEIDLRKGVDIIKKHLVSLRVNKFLYTRVAALLAGMLMKIGNLDEGRKLLEESKSLFQRLPPELKKEIEPTILASDTILAFYENDIERALDNSIREAQLELEKDDLGNYAVGLVHIGVIQAYMGKINDLKRTLEEIEEVSDLLPGDLGDTIKAQASPLSIFTSILEGDLEAAKTKLEEAKRNKFSDMVKGDLFWEEAVLDYLTGNIESAREKARQAIEGSYKGIGSDELALMKTILGNKLRKDEVEKLPRGIRLLCQLIESHGVADRG